MAGAGGKTDPCDSQVAAHRGHARPRRSSIVAATSPNLFPQPLQVSGTFAETFLANPAPMIEPAHASSASVNAGRAKWLGNVLQAVPVEAWPEDAAELESQLAREGATGRTDFERASPEELRGVWPCLRGCADAFLVELARPAGQAKRARAQGEQHAGVQQASTTILSQWM